jgi:hypothetical protein
MTRCSTKSTERDSSGREIWANLKTAKCVGCLALSVLCYRLLVVVFETYWPNQGAVQARERKVRCCHSPIPIVFLTDFYRYVVPAPLEDMLTRSQYIAQAFVYGDNKPYNVTLIVPDLAEVCAN